MKKSSYLTLGKLARQELQDKRVEVARAQNEEDVLQHHLQTLEKRLEDERAFSHQHPLFQTAFATFRQDLITKQATLLQEKKLLDAKLGRLQDHINQLFQRAKSYEVPYERAHVAEQQTAIDREQKCLDEASLTLFQRKITQKSRHPPTH